MRLQPRRLVYLFCWRSERLDKPVLPLAVILWSPVLEHSRSFIHRVVLAANPQNPRGNACSDPKGAGLATDLKHLKIFAAPCGQSKSQSEIVDHIKLFVCVSFWKPGLVPGSPQKRPPFQNKDVLCLEKGACEDLHSGRLRSKGFRHCWKSLSQSPLVGVGRTRRKELW